MKTDEAVYRELYAELEYMAKEEGTYMRDYVMNPEGNIESLAFTNIHQYGQAEITP